jgi:hypothetical protein
LPEPDHDLHHLFHPLHLHRRNRTSSRLIIPGLSQAQPITNPTPRAREEPVPNIISLTKEDEQVITAQELPVNQDKKLLETDFNNLNINVAQN